MSNEKTEKLLEEIKSLIVLQLAQAGVSNEDIGAVLGVSYKTVERILPKKRKGKKTRN
jgi:DNA-binding NarL/FixJ family response regulator